MGGAPVSQAAHAARAPRIAAVAMLTLPVVLAAGLIDGGRPSLTAALAACAVVVAVTAAAGVPPAERPGRLAAAVGSAQLAGHAALWMAGRGSGSDGCLPAVGRGAQVALRLGLLRQQAACPPGSLASTRVLDAAVLCLLLAVGIVLCHAAAAALSGVLLVAAETALHAVRVLAATVLPSVPRGGLPVVPARAPLPPAGPPPPRTPAPWRGPAGRRGPPGLAVTAPA